MNELELLRRIQDLERKTERQESHSHLEGWKSWTPTQTGWSGTPDITARYFCIGKTVLFTIYVSGTSNSTDAYLSLPFTAASVNGWGGACNYIQNNGAASHTPARWKIDSGELIVSFYVSFAGQSWSATGHKLIMAEGFYQIA